MWRQHFFKFGDNTSRQRIALPKPQPERIAIAHPDQCSSSGRDRAE